MILTKKYELNKFNNFLRKLILGIIILKEKYENLIFQKIQKSI